jgi:hypothetical protein
MWWPLVTYSIGSDWGWPPSTLSVCPVMKVARSDTSTRARGRVDGRGLRRAGFETEQPARFRYRGDLAAEVLNDAHGLLDEHGVSEPRFWTFLHSLYARARRRPGATKFGFSRQER